jgi:Spy/CpxP family protein refolding chaperone
MNASRSIALVLLLAAAGAVAAGPHHGARGPGPDLDRLAERLELTEDQRVAVRGILADARADARAEGPATRDERRTRVREALAGVLTPAQLAELDALRAERHDARRAHREARFERLAERLELHESQRAPVEAILRDARTRAMAAVREARAGDADREAVHATMTAVREETRDALSAVLTPAQLETYDAVAERRGRHRMH